MTEHEKLKKICDEIGYDVLSLYSIYNIDEYYIMDFDRVVEAREIIFTPEFMQKFNFYLVWTKKIDLKQLAQIQCSMFDNLDDPVSYIYSLLELWT